MIFIMILRLAAAIALAFLTGKLVAKLKPPSILGWLIAGMVLGPHALTLVNQNLLDAGWYQAAVHILECGVGLMIGTELVRNKIRYSGKSIVITTLTQSLGTFLLVSLVFGIVFYISGTPVYTAFIFGGIALATALSIVREFKTDGPVTKTLIPMAALDDIVGCIVFFTTIALIAGHLSAGEMPAYMIALVVILPLVIGAAVGIPSGFILKKERSKPVTLSLLPHSGVSLVFTGIAVSVLKGPAPAAAAIIQGTIAAAAVINEIIAVIAAKKGFEWAGEFHKSEEE